MKKILSNFNPKQQQFNFIGLLILISLFSSTNYWLPQSEKEKKEEKTFFLSEPDLELGTDVLICPGDSYSLNPNLTEEAENYSFSWSPNGMLNNPNSFYPIATPADTTTLTLSVDVTLFKNLIVNGDFNDGDAGFTSDLEFIEGSIASLDSVELDTGEFTIGVDPNDAWGHMTTCTDYSGLSYNMMIINASETESDETEMLWSQTITCLRPSKTYRFSAWFASLKDKHVTTIRIRKPNGTLTPLFEMQQYLCEWKEQTFTFVANAAGVATISIYNVDGQWKADDIAIDHISLRREPEIIMDQITINVAQPVDVSLLSTPSCFGQNNGSIIVARNSGKLPFDYGWNPTNQNTDSLFSLSPDIYTVTVTDDNSCTTTESTIIDELPPLQSMSIVDDVLCNGGSDGLISFVGSVAGCAQLDYKWSTGDSIAVLANVPAGSYAVTITDCNSCQTMHTVVVGQPDVVQLVYSVESPTCYNGLDGFILIDTITGGTPGFEISKDSNYYEWTHYPFLIDDLGAGMINFSLIDEHDCIIFESIEIPEPPEVSVDLGDDQLVMLGESIYLPAVLTGNIETLIWTRDSAISCLDCEDPWITPTENSTFTLTVIDSFGCTASDDINFYLDIPYSIYTPNVFSPNGDQINDFFTILVGSDVRKINSMRIFNRWGGLIFEAGAFLPNAPELRWDGTYKGKHLNSGVFVCVAEVEYINGEVIIKRQDVTLISN